MDFLATGEAKCVNKSDIESIKYILLVSLGVNLFNFEQVQSGIDDNNQAQVKGEVVDEEFLEEGIEYDSEIATADRDDVFPT